MSEPEQDSIEPPKPTETLWQQRAPLALLTGSLVALLISGWIGHNAIDDVREQLLAQSSGHPVLVEELAHQSKRVIGGTVAGALLLLGAAVLLRHAMTQNRRDDAKRADQQQLAALGRMSAVLAHEIRNPLASLKGHAQLLAEQLKEGTREHRKATRVVNEAMRLEVLTNSLLDFVRAGSVERKQVDPRSIMMRAVETVKNKRISVDLDKAPNSFSLDPVRIEQLLVNLLRNALQADPKSNVQATVMESELGLVFKIQDDGPGLPEGGKRIFESFRTTKTRGTGLGLSVARRIVELHQGKIQAIDLPTGGALFVATIPPEDD